MLYLLAGLRNSAVRVIYVTSREISQPALNYYFELVPGLSREHQRRLTLITCSDPPGHPLAQKLLLRPDVLQQLRNAIQATDDAYLECFVSTDAERDLGVRA